MPYKSIEERRKHRMDYYYKHREDSILKMRKYHRGYIKNLKINVVAHYSKNKNVCSCCGESEIDFLTIDHINNDGAEHRRLIKRRNIYSWLITNNYPDNFQILCMNCNFAKGHRQDKTCPHMLKNALKSSDFT